MNAMRVFITLAHAFVIWILCGATIGIGMAVTSVENTLIAHAIAAPIFSAVVSLVYFRKLTSQHPCKPRLPSLAS